MLIQRTTCLGCGAPLGLAEGQHVLICAYCNSSLRVAVPTTAGVAGSLAQAEVTSADVPKEEIQRIRDMLLAGERDAAIAHYVKLARVSTEDATKAVDQLAVMTLFRTLRQAPMNGFGFVLSGTIMAAPVLGGYFAVRGALAGTWGLWLLAVMCLLVLVWRVIGFVPRAISTVVASYGTEGRARVLRRTILKAGYVAGGTLVQVLFEVTPARGGASFLDEEALLLREESVEKLAPGNIVSVRYDEPSRKRVFPISPITVVGRSEVV